MSSSPKNAAANPAGGAVAVPLPAPYTGAMANGRPAAAAPWWQDVVRFWVPVLGIGGAVLGVGAAVLFQMVGMQRQMGELRSEMVEQIAALRTEMVEQNAALRTEMVEQNAALRAELTAEMATLRTEMTTLRTEMATLRTDLGERITRLEALMEVRPESRAPGSAAQPGEASADRPAGP